MLAYQRLPGGFVLELRCLIRLQQVVYECLVVWKAMIGILIQPQGNSWDFVTNIREIGFQVAPGENLCNFIGECFEILFSLMAQIPSRQLVIPRFIGKLLHGPAVDRLLLSSDLVLLQKLHQLFVKTGVIRIPVELASQHGQRSRNIFQ